MNLAQRKNKKHIISSLLIIEPRLDYFLQDNVRKKRKYQNMTRFPNRKTLGAWGERVAAEYLLSQGYQIIAANFRTSFGEIDLVCRSEDIWCFVEVKTRRTQKYGFGYQGVTRVKQKHMILAAQIYLDQAGLYDAPVRFDVVSIDWISGSDYRIELIKNAIDSIR